jgi:glycosyltransferase involved in cell wall biosynthesis
MAQPAPIWALGVVVPPGVDLELTELKGLQGQFRSRHPGAGSGLIVTFLGRLVHQKGLNLLIPAFAQVVEAFPDSHLVIAGPVEDKYGRALTEWVRARRIEDRVIFTGFVDGAVKAALLADTDIWVLPSREENFGIAIAEAMACGLPVFVSDNTGFHADVAAARAGLVVRCEVAEIVAALAKLMNDPELRRTLGRNGQALVLQRFTWESAAQQMMAVYEAIRRK